MHIRKKRKELHGDQLKIMETEHTEDLIVSGIQQQQFELLLHH